MEGTEIGVLMLSICICGTLLYGTESPLRHLYLSRFIRSMLMGAAIAVTTFLIIRSPFGRRTGAHFNPSVTLTFFWLTKVHRWDAVGYIVAQFTGAIAGVLIAREALGMQLSAPSVRYLVTVPGNYGILVAFAYEYILSALLMGIVLYASNHRVLTRFTPILVAMLTIFFFALSSSISGFSVNPARSFSSALFAWVWKGVWIYFVAPCLGMLTAAKIYVKSAGLGRVYCAKVFHDTRSTCPFACHFERVVEQK